MRYVYERPLVRNKKEGLYLNSDEYRRIAKMYLNDIYKAALSCCKNKADAEDAAQSAFLKLLKSDVEFTDDEHVKRWLICVAVNECKSLWRSFSRKKVISIEELETEPYYNEESGGELFSILAKLPQNYCSVIHLYYYEGYNVKEISKILGISETNAQTRLMRARKKLEQILKKEALL